MTSPGSDPPPPAPGPPTRSVGPWPEGFRGVGGHLIRPPATPDLAEPLPTVSTDWLAASHGSHLLAPIASCADGSRAASCPVCVTPAPLPPTGGWVEARCDACGTEFVATDGSPPPAPLPPPAPPPRPSPIAPPFEPFEPLPDAPRSFTSDVRTDPDGRRFVTCPHCRGANVFISPDATVVAFQRCPACHTTVLVNLGAEPAPVIPPVAGLLLPPPRRPPRVYDPDGRLWDHCPNCGLAALVPGRDGRAFVLTCGVCGQQIVVNEGPHPPRHPPLPAPPSVWERIRRWFRGR